MSAFMKLGDLLLIALVHENAGLLYLKDKLDGANKVFKAVGFRMIQRVITGNQQYRNLDGIKIKAQCASGISQGIRAMSNDDAVIMPGSGGVYGCN